MKFKEEIKQRVTESVLEELSPKNKMDNSVYEIVFSKYEDLIKQEIDKFDLLAHEIPSDTGKFHLQIKLPSPIGLEFFIPITRQEGNAGSKPLTRKEFGKFAGWQQQDKEPKETNILNIILDKHYKIKKIYAGRFRENSQDFYNKYKYVG